MSISIVYWSGTGNTEAMANALADGIREAGGEAALITVDSAGAEALASEEVFALGCPSMGAEELEESEMEPFVAELEGKVKGKKIDRKSTRLNSSHVSISYAVFCLKNKITSDR